MNIIHEYMDEINRLRDRIDILRTLLVDEIQFNRGVTRNEAEARVDLETFQKLQQDGAVQP